MRKLILLIALTSAVAAHAAPSPNATQLPAGTDEPLDSLDSQIAPMPEPPYPGSEEGAYAADPSLSGPLHDTEPAPSEDNWQAANGVAAEDPEEQVEKPTRIDEEGNYIYDTAEKPKRYKGAPGVDAPIGASTGDDLLYDKTPVIPKFSNRAGVERPISIKADGEFRYKTEEVTATRAASFRIGVLTPPSIQNPDNGLKFGDVYGSAPAPVLFLDYEWPLFSTPIGQLVLKGGTGLMASSGKGHFRNASRAAEVPDESFTFLMFPNTVTASYRFRFTPKQVVVPFVEGGAGYYTFAEIRDDAKKPKFGASPVGVAAGGLNFLLDWLDPVATRELGNEYGIAHAWVVAEARQTIGLHSELDFTATSFNLGFMLEF